MRETDSLLINYGGKSRIAASLVQHFPRGPRCYVEPFFGGGGIYFAVPQELYPVRVINDLNKSIVTFYKVLRERPEELYRVCSLTPYAFDEQRACRDSTQDPLDDELELARRVWVRQRQNFGGRQGANTGWRRGTHTMSMAACTDEKLQQFYAFADRMRRVEINNTDAVELIQDYAKPGVFLYCMHPQTMVRLCEDEHLVTVEDVQVGDRIAPGRTVLSKFSRQHSGPLYSILLQGHVDTLKLTGEHRVLSIPGRKAGTRQDYRTGDQLWAERRLVTTGELRVGDYLAIPQSGDVSSVVWDVETSDSFKPDRDLFRAIGYYAAEGYLQWGKKQGMRTVPYTTCWGFCVDEEFTYVKDLGEICQKTFGVSIKAKQFRDTGTLRVYGCSKTMAQFFHQCVPGTAHNKKLESRLMVAPPEDQIELLKGWLRGDGGLDKSSRNRCKLVGTTMSKQLAHQMYTIALRCGLRPSMKLRAGKIWDVYFSSEDARLLGWDVPAKKFRSQRRASNGHLLVKIRSIDISEYSGVVWDIDVDGDDLFAAPYALIHNCDPPYYPEARKSNVDYTHEMSPEQHLKLAQALHAAANAGALVAISGYDCEFYNSQYGNWRRVEYEHTVSSTNFVDAEQRSRTEIMWMNYPASIEIGASWKPAVKAKDSRERALLSMLRNQGKVGR